MPTPPTAPPPRAPPAPAPAPVTGRLLLEQICACPSLPSVPTIVAELLEATAGPDVDLRQVSRTIARDPALVARVLRTVNSSYYGLPHRLASIARALPMLGLKNLRIMLAGHSIFGVIKPWRTGDSPQLDLCDRSPYFATA